MSTRCTSARRPGPPPSSTRAARGSAPRSRPSCWPLALVTGSVWLLAAAGGRLRARRGAAARRTACSTRRLVRPRLGPPAELEDTRPLRFAQAVGLAFTAGRRSSASRFDVGARCAARDGGRAGRRVPQRRLRHLPRLRGLPAAAPPATPIARTVPNDRTPPHRPATEVHRMSTRDRERSSSTPTGSRPTSTTRRWCSSRSTRTPPPTTRTTSGAPSAWTGRRTCRTRSAATS